MAVTMDFRGSSLVNWLLDYAFDYDRPIQRFVIDWSMHRMRSSLIIFNDIWFMAVSRLQFHRPQTERDGNGMCHKKNDFEWTTIDLNRTSELWAIGIKWTPMNQCSMFSVLDELCRVTAVSNKKEICYIHYKTDCWLLISLNEWRWIGTKRMEHTTELGEIDGEAILNCQLPWNGKLE